MNLCAVSQDEFLDVFQEYRNAHEHEDAISQGHVDRQSAHLPQFALIWPVSWPSLIRSARLRAKIPALVAGLNGAFVLVFLRLALPRILAMQARMPPRAP
jgi:hypothetical protein